METMERLFMREKRVAVMLSLMEREMSWVAVSMWMRGQLFLPKMGKGSVSDETW
jgi:hypothetical protein